MGFDPAVDFELVMDGQRLVMLEVYGTADRVALHAHKRRMTTREVEPSSGLARLGDVWWSWPVAELRTQPPLGSVIVDAGDRWTMLAVEQVVLGVKWRALCRNLAVEARLDTLVTIQQATYEPDAWGVAIPTWADAYTSVRARVQWIDAAAEVQHGADEVAETYRVILESDLSFSPGADYRVVDSDGETYAVRRYERPERIDALPVLMCERVTSLSSSSGS